MKSTLLAFFLTAVATLSLASAAALAATPTLPADTGLNFTLTPAQLSQTCDAAIASAKQAIEKILAAPPQTATFATLQAIETAEADFNDATVVQAGAFNLAPDKAVRDASLVCNQSVSNYQVQLSSDPRIYAVATRVATLGDAKTAADQKLDEYYVDGGKRSGAGLSDAARKQVTALFDHLNDLERDFQSALDEDKTSIPITKTEAKSLPQSFVATLAKTATGYVVPVNESTYDAFMISEVSGDARKRYSIAYSNRGGLANVKRLQDAVAVRDQLAHMLGFSSWAAYQLDAKMAKTPSRVESLLNTVSSKLLPKADQEIATLGALKRKQGDTKPFASWDYFYYENQLIKSQYQVDQQMVRQYFPIEHVVSSVLDIYQNLLGVTFAEIVARGRVGTGCPRVLHHGHSERQADRVVLLRSVPSPRQVRTLRQLPDSSRQSASRRLISKADIIHRRQLAGRCSRSARAAESRRRDHVLP